MGFAEVVPADGLAQVTLRCCGCPAERSWAAPFYSDRIRVLGAARREGWGFLADGRRRCPVCQAIAGRFGRRGSLAHELRRGGVHTSAHKSGPDFPTYAEPVFAASAVQDAGAPLHKAPVSLRAPPSTLQLDLFAA
ncbi:MAG: hypothetical protein WAS21_10405 [Geminicoccaceae bacterium]